MSMMDKYNKIASGQNKVMQTVTEFVKGSLPFLILLLNIVVAITTRLFSTDIQNPFTPDFFIGLFTNMLTTMVCYSCFVKYGEKNEKLSSATYAKNVERWSKMSGDIRSRSSDRFIAYCRQQVELEREDIRHFQILNHTMITVEEYESKYKRLTDKEVDGLVAKGVLHRKDARYIKRANATRCLKPINPILILCGVNKMNINDVGRDGVNASTMAILTRPVYMFILSTVLTMFSGHWKGIDGASAVFDIIYSALLIVIASITGYTAGADAGRKDHDRIKGRIFFLERYMATEETVKADGQS